MANHALLYGRPLAHDEDQPSLGVVGKLPDYDQGTAYVGELDVVGSVGRVTVEVLASALPPGATVRIDNIRKKIVVKWPPFVAKPNVQTHVPNGGFEDGDDGYWEKQAGWSIGKHDSYNVETGQWSAKFADVKTKGSSIHLIRVPAKVNDNITFNARIQQGASSKGNAGARCHLRYLDENGVELSAPSGPMVSSGSGGEWKNSGGTAAAPAKTAWVEVWVAAYRNRQNKPLFVDNVTWNHSYVLGTNKHDEYNLTVRITDGLNRDATWSGAISYVSKRARSNRYPALLHERLSVTPHILSAGTRDIQKVYEVYDVCAIGIEPAIVSAGTRDSFRSTNYGVESIGFDPLVLSAKTRDTYRSFTLPHEDTFGITPGIVKAVTKQVLYTNTIPHESVALTPMVINARTS